MSYQVILLFIFSVFCSLVLLWGAFRLRLKYPTQYLQCYYYFMLCVVSYGFINWIAPILLAYFSSLQPDENILDSIVLIVCIALPLLQLKFYFFSKTLFSILNQSISKKMVSIFLALSLLILLAVGYVLFLDYPSGQLIWSKSFIFIVSIAFIIGDYLLIAYFLSQISGKQSTTLERSASYFGWAYLIGYFIYASPYYLASWIDIPWYAQIGPFLFYLLHLIPLLILLRFHPSKTPIIEGSDDKKNILELFTRYQISKREQAIVEQLLSGKNNQEIADLLFISPNTVRNHVYHIYGKMLIKNRMQLVALCVDYRFH